MQHRLYLAGAALLLTLSFAAPAAALTAQEKMETCKFGAADQKLTGKKQQDFIKKCMADEPATKTGTAPAPQPKK